MRICRICKKYIDRHERLFKYATRHYAHYACYLKAKGAEGFSGLSAWQLKQFPYIIVKEMGLMGALENAIARAEGKQTL